MYFQLCSPSSSFKVWLSFFAKQCKKSIYLSTYLSILIIYLSIYIYIYIYIYILHLRMYLTFQRILEMVLYTLGQSFTLTFGRSTLVEQCSLKPLLSVCLSVFRLSFLKIRSLILYCLIIYMMKADHDI